MNIKENFLKNPLNYYGLSIAASWAGVGSLLNSITMTKTYGVIPSLIWAAANIAACMIFGAAVYALPTLRDVIKTRTARYIVYFIAVCNIWLNMTGIKEVFSDTTVGAAGGEFISYAVAMSFVILLLWRGMIRNILTDSASWIAVYILIAVIAAVSFAENGANFAGISLGLSSEAINIGLKKAFLLLSGPYTYVYYYELIEYNEANDDAAAKVDMQAAFNRGGWFFGAYMIFAFSLAFTEFSPALNLVKAILLSLIAISTLSTFIFTIYLMLGRRLGLIVDAAAVILWPLVMDMGVMGVWTMMASIRSYLVGGFILAALAIKYRQEK